MNPKLKLIATLIAGFLIGSLIGYAFSQATLSPVTISGGIFPSGHSYTVWEESGDFYAKTASGEVLEPSGTLVPLLNNLKSALVNGGSIYLYNVKWDSSVSIPINIAVFQLYNGVYSALGGVRQPIQTPYFTRNAYHQDNIISPIGYYDATTNRTYITYQNGDELDVYAMYFSHTLQLWSEAVFIADNTDDDDYHYAPAIMMDGNSYLHVFFGIHISDNNLHHYRSTNPSNISAWTNIGDIALGGSATYQNVVKAGSNYYIFFRGDDVGKISYIKSTDNMATFGAVTGILDFDDANYAVYGSDYEYDPSRGAIQIAFYLFKYGGVNINVNIYLVYFKISDGHVYAIDGSDYGTEITKAEADGGASIVLNSETPNYWAWGARLELNATDSYYPYVLFTNGSSNPATTSIFQFSRWNGAAWTSPASIPPSNANGYNDWGDMEISGGTLRAYLNLPLTWDNSVPEYEDSAILLFESVDRGATWTMGEIVASSREIGYIPFNLHEIDNSNSDLEMIFEVYNYIWGADVYGVNLKLYGYGQRGYVYNYEW